MTTKVTVQAHCASDKEVSILLTSHGHTTVVEHKIIKDGETHELYVYDDRQVDVCERLKK